MSCLMRGYISVLDLFGQGVVVLFIEEVVFAGNAAGWEESLRRDHHFFFHCLVNKRIR